MITNIIIAGVSLFVGCVIGLYTATWVMLSKYSKYPKEVIALLDEYAEKWRKVDEPSEE